MIIESAPIREIRQVAKGMLVVAFESSRIARMVLPGQFVNIKVDERTDPLLRRPFSVYHVAGTIVEVVFQVIGKGTDVLARRALGETLNVVGPLGSPFHWDEPGWNTGVIIAGGLGVAAVPLLSERLRGAGKDVLVCLGSRTSSTLVRERVENPRIATDDGSEGFHGNAVELARTVMAKEGITGAKIFACGPSPMLRAAQTLASSLGVPGELSLEGPMGCGFGICQGCPVEFVNGPRRYGLMCKDGPVFNSSAVKF